MLYKYKGPVALFGKVSSNCWQAETIAPNEKKALSQFRYQYAKYASGNPNCGGIVLSPKYIKPMEEHVDDK